MKVNVIAERYVQALLELSENDEDTIAFGNYLKEISCLFTSNDEFQKLLKNPCILNDEKLSIIKEIFPDISNNEVFVNFLNLLLESGRMEIIESIYEEYIRINHHKNHELNMKIIVASKMDENQIQEITEKYQKIYQASKVNYTVEIDENIIGGIKVIIGNTVYDSTLKTQLEEIF